MSATRIEFLQRVKNALGRAPNQPIPDVSHPSVPENLIRQVSADDPNLLTRWLQLATKNGMLIEKVSPDGTLSAITRCLSNHQARKVLLNLQSFDGQTPVREHLASINITTHSWGDLDCRQIAYQCDASITDCRYALADTGALLVWSDQNFGRSSTLTVPIHIVLLPANRILPDLVDGLSRVLQDCHGQMPSNVVVINGPSKTADIEMNLITGVHGPKYLYVIVVE